MPLYPARDLTNRYVSQSYQDVLQRYGTEVLDGLGNSLFDYSLIGSSSSAATASWAISASQATSASWAPMPNVSNFISSSQTSSMSVQFAINSSQAQYAVSASWAPGSDTLNTSSLQDTIATDFIKTRSGIINRDGNGFITSIQKTGGRTITFNRNADNYIITASDSFRVTTFTRNVNNQITSWDIV